MICLTMLWQLQHEADMGTLLAPLMILLFCMPTKQHCSTAAQA
jgi:hypothetical protein